MKDGTSEKNSVPLRRLLQSGTIPYRERPSGVEFLLVTSQRGNWIFPKGIVEPNESPEDTAVKETREEAGVSGMLVSGPLGSYDDFKWRTECTVQLYLLRYLEDVHWEEGDLRERRWCGYEEAMRLIKKDELRDLLVKAQRRIESDS